MIDRKLLNYYNFKYKLLKFKLQLYHYYLINYYNKYFILT